MTKNFAVVSLFVFALFPPATRAAESSRCYRIPVGSPEMARDAKARTETWCYQKPGNLAGGLYIYNADLPSVRPELALLLEADGTITHGSLSAGKLTMHRVHSTHFNPYSVPLKEPSGQYPVVELERELSDDVFSQLLSHRGTTAQMSLLESPAAASSAVRPWRGYWWPYKNRPLQRGPYARFDQFVRHRTGSSAGTAAWEDTYHRYKGVWWEGHCNGWAAASVLRSEPTFARVDVASGIVFSVSDQKAYWSGIDYCVNSAFFGERYRNTRNNPRDIHPHIFHKTLSYYIGSLRKPVAIDYRADATVDNHVVSAYSFNMQPAGANRYSVTATLTVHKYDGSITNIPGTAPAYTRVYKYILLTNNAGVPVGGSWLSANPDFLWVPLSPRTCGSNNPRLKHEWVNAIMGLPSR